MNKVFLLGRLTKDPESKYTQSGKCVVTFTVAINRFSEGADFIPCVAWGKTAETICNNVAKGERILVEGRIQTRNYETGDGSKRYVTEVVVDRFEFVEKKGNKKTSADTAADDKKNAFVAPSEFFDESIPF